MGKQWKQWQTSFSWAPKSLQMVTAAMKLRHLLLERKGAYYQPRSYYHMTNLDSILKSRDISLPTKVHLVKAMVFPAVMYGCESWTITKAERWRIDAFELWCWRRLLRVPWTARRSNQSILNAINPEYSLEGLILKLKFQYFGHLMGITDSLEKSQLSWCWGRLKAGGEWDDRGWNGWMESPTQCTWVWAISGCQWWIGKPGLLQSMGLQRVRHNWATKLIHHFNKLKNKNHDNFNGCRVSFWQNWTTFYDKISPESWHRGSQLQHNKGHIWQTHSKHHSQGWKSESISSEVKDKDVHSCYVYST